MSEDTDPSGKTQGSQGTPEVEASFPTLKRAAHGVFPTFGRTGRSVWRWRGWRIGLKGLLVLLILLAIAEIVATLYFGGRTRAKLADLKAHGAVLNFVDIVPKPVPAAQNGAPLYIRAAGILKQRNDRYTARPDEKRAPRERYDPDWSKPAEVSASAAFVREDADVLALVKQGAAKPYCVFDVNWEAVYGALFPHLARMRDLARFMRVAVVEASMRGDQAEALERLRVGFVMSRQVLSEPTLIAQLVSYAIDAIMSRAAGDVFGRGPLPEDAARRLAEELARPDQVAAFVKSMECERAAGLWGFDMVRGKPGEMVGLVSDLSGSPLPKSVPLFTAGAYVLRPLFYADEECFLNYMDRVLAESRQPWREVKAEWAHETDRGNLPRYAILTRILTPVFSRAAMKRDGAIAGRALLCAAMALEVIRGKEGRYPASLSELKARVGWANTEDVSSGKDLVYRLSGPRYRLYSVGSDGKDDGGKPLPWQRKALGDTTAQREPDQEAGDLVWLPELSHAGSGRGSTRTGDTG